MENHEHARSSRWSLNAPAAENGGRAAVFNFLFFISYFLFPAYAHAQSKPVTPRALLSQAVDLYMEGKYREAADRLRPLVESRVLGDQADQKEALRAYGSSLYLSGGKVGAERAFRDLLRLDPKEKLDPGFVRPEVIVFFENVRQKYQAELNTVVKLKTGWAWVNVLPPWGQFQNGHHLKGWLLLSGEVLAIATWATSWGLLNSWKGPHGTFPGHEDHFRPVQTVQFVAFSLTIALVAYGIADGFYYYYKTPFARESPKVGAAGHMLAAPPQPALFRF